MRYTRYNYKKKKENNVGKTIVSFLLMSIFVVGVGVLLANVIIYFLPINNANGDSISKDDPKVAISDNASTDSSAEAVDSSAEAENTSGDVQGLSKVNTSFAIIQCGYFSKNENASLVLNQISNEYGAFISNESDKFKVLAGVCALDEADSIVSNLQSSGVESVKFEVTLDKGDVVQEQISAICDGYIKILNTALKSNVEFVSTEDFKSWISNLDEINDGDNNELLTDLKLHINELGTEVKKVDVAKEMEFLYKILLNFNK